MSINGRSSKNRTNHSATHTNPVPQPWVPLIPQHCHQFKCRLPLLVSRIPCNQLETRSEAARPSQTASKTLHNCSHAVWTRTLQSSVRWELRCLWFAHSGQLASTVQLYLYLRYKMWLERQQGLNCRVTCCPLTLTLLLLNKIELVRNTQWEYEISKIYLKENLRPFKNSEILMSQVIVAVMTCLMMRIRPAAVLSGFWNDDDRSYRSFKNLSRASALFFLRRQIIT